MTGKTVGRRAFMGALSGALSSLTTWGQRPKPPNVIVILADDLGYGDVGCYGSDLSTPNLDRMAAEGIRLERHYSASPVCSPSRAALLTGRYPVRCGVTNVLMPDATGGLNASEATLPRMLRERGYKTACIGKWHLGTRASSHPNSVGFDEYYGVPYSHDMYPLPLLHNSQVVDSAARQANLTEQFTTQAIDFIDKSKDQPFFLYLSHTAPHIPLVPSERFRDMSGHGIYGDTVAELDWSVGEILNALQRNGIDEQTLVIFTSDNGPWYQGSAGRLRGRKGSTYEGGVRVPCIARFPGQIQPGAVSAALTSTMDIHPTVAALSGAPIPPVAVDGVDIWPVLTGAKPFIEREALLFFDGLEIQCVRWGPWKLHLSRYNSFAWTQDPAGGRFNLPLNPPELYNIDSDSGESYDRSLEKPQLIKDLRARVERLLLTLPEPVRVAWQDTQNQKVISMPTGALPRRNP